MSTKGEIFESGNLVNCQVFGNHRVVLRLHNNEQEDGHRGADNIIDEKEEEYNSKILTKTFYFLFGNYPQSKHKQAAEAWPCWTYYMGNARVAAEIT